MLSYMTLPMRFVPEPEPMSSGVMKSPSVSEKVKIDPAMTPGRTSGSTTLRSVRRVRAPRSAEASKNESGIRSKAP